MADNNFLQWNPGTTNQEVDSAYAGDSQRSGGAPSGSTFPSLTANKLFFQSSTMAAAIAYMMQLKGYSCLDGSSPVTAAGTPSAGVIALAAVLANLVTNADLKTALKTTSVSNIIGLVSGDVIASFTIPGNSMGANGHLRITYTVQALTVSTSGFSMTIGFGGSVLNAAYFSPTQVGGYFFEFELFNRNATNAQDLSGYCMGSLVSGGTITFVDPGVGANTLAKDTTVNQTLTVVLTTYSSSDHIQISPVLVEFL